jgi:transcription-repair coupling factor (superfamily II helicase)
MDYKLAHSINRLIDPSLLRKKTNSRNINDVQSEREHIPIQFTDREQVDYAKYLHNLEKKERKRVINMHKTDEQILKQFENVNKRMISYKTS